MLDILRARSVSAAFSVGVEEVVVDEVKDNDSKFFDLGDDVV